MIHNSADDIPPKTQGEILEGLKLLGRKLRQWRQHAELHQLSAQWLTADGTVGHTSSASPNACSHDPWGCAPSDLGTKGTGEGSSSLSW